ncbi:MAG: SLBB domain-containing protein [Synechococcaceae cyanobacterium ELA263]
MTAGSPASISRGGRSRIQRRAVGFVAALALLSPLTSALPALARPTASATAQATATAQAAAGGTSEFDSYILGAGDGLELSFLSAAFTNLGGSFELLNDGSTSLPMLGSVVLDGLTVSQANRWLTGLYSRYLRQPGLNLRVVKPRPMQVSVVGEVENPGLYLLSPGGEASSVEGQSGSIPGLPTVVSLIQKAGGITLNANLGDVRLQRRIPSNANQLKETQLDLVALLQQGDKRQNPFLFDGDTIVISRAAAPPPDQVLQLAAANLSPQSINVNVIGEVKSPGKQQLRAGTPLIQAVLAAGGPVALRANRNNVELVRINRNGTATLRRYAIDYSLGVSGPRNPPLRDGDTVVVNRSVFANGSDAINAVGTPITGLVNVLALFRIIQDYNNTNTN